MANTHARMPCGIHWQHKRQIRKKFPTLHCQNLAISSSPVSYYHTNEAPRSNIWIDWIVPILLKSQKDQMLLQVQMAIFLLIFILIGIYLHRKFFIYHKNV